MKTRRKLRPGQPGTKKLVEQYGEQLVCVRYRYDVQRHRKVKTVELIVEESEWYPDPTKIPPNKRMPIKVAYGERDLAARVKAAGGRWNSDKKVWEVAYRAVVALQLEDRLVKQEDVESV